MRQILNAGDSLTAVLSGAAATTNPTYFVDWAEGSNQSVTPGSLSGATAVTLLAGAGGNRRYVNSIVICNIDTAAVTVTLKRSDGTTTYTITAITLQVGDTLILDANGITVIDSSGNRKQSATSTIVQPFAIPITRWTKTDGITVNPASAATTNHGLIMGTDGTNFPHLETIDGKAATTAVVSRTIVTLPANYVAGSAITIRVRAGMKTSVADGSCTVGLNVYSNAGTAQNGSADLNTTSAQSCNSLTNANLDFTITPTGLVAGQDLHIKLTQTITDAATGTAVIAVINHVELRTSVSQ